MKIKTKYGDINVRLPGNIRAGDHISGTVTIEPKGETKKPGKKIDLDTTKPLSKYKINIENSTSGMNEPQFEFGVPNYYSGGIITGIVLDDKNKEVDSFKIPVNPVPRNETKPFTGFTVPPYLRSGYTEYFSGNFDGKSGNTSVKVGQTPVDVIAESPGGIFCAIPEYITGSKPITVIENDTPATKQCNIVGLLLTADKTNLLKGESTRMQVKVSGLENLPVPVPITLENFSPKSVTIEGGPRQTIIIYPRDVSSEGNYIKNFNLTAVRSGGFSVRATLDDPDKK